MMPAMLPFYPTFAANILLYRYNSLAEANRIARVFGYNGSMFAWTAYVFMMIILK
jgi:trehalose/maltose hydrolase-like predicted phosphorylase